MKFSLHKIRGLILGFLIWIIYKILFSTWKITIEEPESLKNRLVNKIPVIFGFFHGDELVFVSLTKRYQIAVITSTSKDGELMTTVVHLLGGKTSRGSSTRRGASALKGLLEHCKKGSNASFAVDGPKGPIYEIKPGIFETSRIMKSEIYVGGVYCDRAWHFPKAWNKTFLPKPFANVRVVWTGPIGPITKADDPRSAELAKALQNQLFAAKQQAANLFGSNAAEL